MNSVNHALWGAVIGSVVGMPVAGAVFGAGPDLLSVPVLAYFHTVKHHVEPSQQPRWVFIWYALVHNWLIGISLTIGLYFMSPTLAVLGAAFWWHQAEDAFLHRLYATPFLFPLWHGKVIGYSASEHKWVQVVDLLVLVTIYLAVRLRL